MLRRIAQRNPVMSYKPFPFHIVLLSSTETTKHGQIICQEQNGHSLTSAHLYMIKVLELSGK